MSGGEKLRVLLVEDNPGDVLLITELLSDRKTELEIDVASDGEEALNYLFGRGRYQQAISPQLVVLDLNLPRVSGLDVLAILRKDPRMSPLPVVVLSSSDAERDIVESYCRGANTYIQKPVDLRQFQEAVAKIESFWLSLAKLPSLQKPAPKEEKLDD